ncbi:MAG: response regulator transcription factor [Anaerolineae bacterium]|nr:response regulator transcription factor [Anaerolineae bacterium]
MDVHKIWVISPDPDTRRLIGLNLNKRGFGVLETSPQDGLVPSSAEPLIIILDMDPPDESGWEAASVLRQSPGLQETPMILLLSAAPAARRLVPLQPVRWLEKPLAMDVLLALVRESLGRQGAE